MHCQHIGDYAMTCRKRPRPETRKVIQGLFARGESKAAVFHRLAQCLHASDCGRVCERFVKGPGKVAYCVDVQTGAKTELYPALENEEFACPEGRF